jgi:hypothetical protein
MSIEENEDAAVRGLLGTAFAAAEPPLRDLASGSIARGDAVRRRNRLVAAGGATLSVVAVLGTFAVVTGSTPARRGIQNPAEKVTTASTPTTSGRSLGFGPVSGGVAKNLDIAKRLPGLLQPLLPAGITVGQPASDASRTGAFLPTGYLTGPTGTNQATMWVGTAPAGDDAVRQAVCSHQGTCSSKPVEGGIAYLDEHSGTATDEVRGAGLPADVVKPGTGGTIVNRTLTMTFVPTDRSKYAFSITVETRTAKVQYADHEPSDYMTGGEWPPGIFSTMTAYDPSGLLVSAEDLVAMLGKPGLSQVETLLDPRTAVSQDTQNQMRETEAQVAAAAQAALPSGTKASVEENLQQLRMIVTGPTGKNALRWRSSPQTAQFRNQTAGFSAPNLVTSKRTVPGGILVIWADKPMDSKGTILSDTPSGYSYYFFPDDIAKPALIMELSTDASQTGSPVKVITDPGQSYSVDDGPYAPVQVSADQFLAAAQSGRLATAISTTTSLLATIT